MVADDSTQRLKQPQCKFHLPKIHKIHMLDLKPFHLFPELELEESNLIPLCEGRTVNCHLAVGHLFSYRSHNPNVEEDAEVMRAKVKARP